MSRIDVSIVPGGIPPTINVSQYDVGRDIDVKIDMGDLTISDSLTYLLEVKKADRHVTNATGSVQNGGAFVRFKTTQQMTAVEGLAICKVRVKFGTNDLGTALFYMNVEETPFSENADLSDSEISPLLAALAASTAEAVAAKEAAERATATAEAAADAARNIASSISGSMNQIQANTDALATVTVVTDEVTGLRYRLSVRNGEVYMKEVTVNENDS